MPKTETKGSNASSTKKSLASKSAKDVPAKTVASKGSSKGSKVVSKTESTKKSSPKRNQTEAVGFVYGGALFKGSRVFVFSCKDCKDCVGYVKENLVQFYGSDVSGRYVKCENSEETLEKILDQAKEKGYYVEENCNVLKLSVSDASKLLKDVSGYTSCHNIKVNVGEKTSKKTASKNTKKDAAEGDEADDDDDDEEYEGQEEEREEGEEEEEEEEEEPEEEEEEEPPAKTSAQKKSGKSENPKKGK